MDFDFKHFQHRLGLKNREMARLLGVSTGYVGILNSDPDKKPSFETMVKLIDAGISVEELFGKELAAKLIENSNIQTVKKPTDSELKASIREVMKDLLGDSTP